MCIRDRCVWSIGRMQHSKCLRAGWGSWGVATANNSWNRLKSQLGLYSFSCLDIYQVYFGRAQFTQYTRWPHTELLMLRSSSVAVTYMYSSVIVKKLESKLPLIEVEPTALVWPMTLTLNPLQAVVIAYSLATVQGQRSVGSGDSVETDGRTEATALPPR